MKKFIIALIYTTIFSASVCANDPIEIEVSNSEGKVIENSYSQTDKTLNAKFQNVSSSNIFITLIASIYEEGKISLINLKDNLTLAPNEVESLIINLEDKNNKINILALENLDSMKPLCENVTLNLTEISKNAIYVSPSGNDKTADGTAALPYKTINEALDNIKSGQTLYLMSGTYKENVYVSVSGSENAPITIKSYPEAKAVIEGDKSSESIGIEIEAGVSNLIIEDLEIRNFANGIYYEDSTKKVGKNITIKNNKIHDIGRTKEDVFAIVFYAHNLTPTTNIIIKGNEVYNCQTYTSETITVNGNIDGFEISNNKVHDANNIGIDAIGHEGTCKTTSLDSPRNGIIKNNIVYNVSTNGNEGYKSKTGYDLCSAGIYVDGAHHILIEDNIVRSSDIGIEIGCENKGYEAANITVKNNLIESCNGFGGLVFGGYDNTVGFTRNCTFESNILNNNDIGIIIQQAEGNTIENNFVNGGSIGLLYSFISSDGKLEYPPTPSYADKNKFGINHWYTDNSDLDEFYAWFKFMPENDYKLQNVQKKWFLNEV